MTSVQVAFMWGFVVGLWIAWACYLTASRWLRRTTPAPPPEPSTDWTITGDPDVLTKRDGTRWVVINGVRLIAVDDVVSWLSRDDHVATVRPAAMALALALAVKALEADLRNLDPEET